MLVEILLLLFTVFLGVYYWITKNFGYYKKNGLPEAPGSFPFGSEHFRLMMTRKLPAFEGIKYITQKFPNEKIFGVYNFGQRNIVINDLELAKRVLIKDADYFTDRPAVDTEGATKESDKITGLMLFNMKGEQWKKMRTLVSPVFTSGKLRLMVPHLEKCADNLDDAFRKAAETGEFMEAKEIYGKFALDAIATSGFGIESNSFKEPDSIFRKTALRMVRAEGYGSLMDIPKFLFQFVFPKLARALGISFLPSGTSDFFTKILRQTVEQRRKSGVRRNDIIDLLLDELDKEKESKGKGNKDDFDLELALISNALVFFFGGFDTTALTLGLVIYTFIDNTAIQERARQEIFDVVGDSKKVTADHLNDLKYLENVINEALRFYPINTSLQRICTKDYRVPDTDFTIIKGTTINIEFSALGEECFFRASECNPDNFEAENHPNKFGFFGFGQGPRSCIAMRYAYIALKMALVKTLTKYKVVKCEKTVEKLQFDVAKNNFKGGIMFKTEKL